MRERERSDVVSFPFIRLFISVRLVLASFLILTSVLAQQTFLFLRLNSVHVTFWNPPIPFGFRCSGGCCFCWERKWEKTNKINATKSENPVEKGN